MHDRLLDADEDADDVTVPRSDFYGTHLLCF